ncbi:MAG: glycosyltransferase, partial [bacterium]
NNICASLLLRNRLGNCNIVVTHTAGFWNGKRRRQIYREPGDLRALMKSLPLKSKIGYVIPYLMARYALHRSDPAIAASERAEVFFKSMGLDRFLLSTNFLLDKVQIHSRAYDTAKPFTLVFVGRDDKIKNLSWLERYFKMTSLPVRLEVVGIKKRDTDNIAYHGWIKTEHVQNVLKNAHALVLPSLFEASPLVVLDALAQGLPVFISENAVPAELKKYVNIFSDEKEFEKKLAEIINHYEYALQNRVDTAVFIQKQYNKETVLQREWEAIGAWILEAGLQDP